MMNSLLWRPSLPSGHHRSRGQALVEFAMVAPIFLILLLGIFEGARFIFNYEMLNNAVRDGTRHAIIRSTWSSCPSGVVPNPPTGCYVGDDTVIANRVTASALGLVDNGTLVVSVCWGGESLIPPCSNNRSGSTVVVGAQYTYSALIPLLPPINIGAESKLVINY